MTTKLAFDAAHFAVTTEALRKAEVTSENKRSEWGRETLCGLFSDAMTEGDLTAALLAAFRPKKPTGKAGDSLSSLRYAKGGDAVRKAAQLCLDIVAASEAGAVADVLRPIAIAFAVDAPDAPKSLYALRDEMKRLQREAAKAAGNGDESEQEQEQEQEPAAPPLAVMAERMALAVREASPEAILSADGPLGDLLASLREAFERVAAEEQEERKAA